MKKQILFTMMGGFILFITTTQPVAHTLKIYLLAGQSNMQGHANVRTLDHIGMDPNTAPILEAICNEDGTPKVCEDV